MAGRGAAPRLELAGPVVAVDVECVATGRGHNARAVAQIAAVVRGGGSPPLLPSAPPSPPLPRPPDLPLLLAPQVALRRSVRGPAPARG